MPRHSPWVLGERHEIQSLMPRRQVLTISYRLSAQIGKTWFLLLLEKGANYIRITILWETSQTRISSVCH